MGSSHGTGVRATAMQAMAVRARATKTAQTTIDRDNVVSETSQATKQRPKPCAKNPAPVTAADAESFFGVAAESSCCYDLSYRIGWHDNCQLLAPASQPMAVTAAPAGGYFATGNHSTWWFLH